MTGKKADKVVEVEPTQEAPKLSDEQIAALEQEKAALVASLIGKPSTVAVAEPVAQSAGKEPVIVVEPDETTIIAQLKALQDQKAALQAQQEVQASALEQAERALIAKLGQAQQAVKQAEGQKLLAQSGMMVETLTSADAAHAQTVALTQKEQDKALREEFAPHVERVEKIDGRVATFAKEYAPKLKEMARESEDGWGPEGWDARLRVRYRDKVGLPSRDLLRLLAHHRQNIPALLSDLKSFLGAGARQGESWEGERAELLWRAKHVVPEIMRDLDSDTRIVLAALKDLLQQVKTHTGPVTKLEALPIPPSLRGPGLPKTTTKVGLVGGSDLVKGELQGPGGAKAQTDWDPHA